MMKRTIAMLLVLIMALSMLPVTAGAAEIGTMDIPRTYAAQFNEVESNNTRATANTFNPNSQYVYGVVGDYYSIDDDYDWFKFSVSSNYHMKLEALAADAGDMKFCLYNSAGSLLKTSSFVMTDPILEIDEHTMEYTLAPGTYYIRVNESAPLWRCNYAFSVILTPMLNTPTVSLSNRASDGKIKISWNSVSYASSYRITRSTSKNGSYTTIATTSSTSYYDTTAVAGTTYWYKVQAISGSSSYLDSNYSTPNDRTCDLPQPTGVKATKSDSTGKVKITWNKVSGADKYNVYCSTDGGSTYSLLKTVTGTSLTHASATLGTTCRYKIMAVDSDKSSANSAYSSVVKGTATCAAPTITLTNVASSGKVKITWEKVTGAKSYEVYRSADGSNWTLIKTVTGTSLTNTSANAGETWYYRVRAIGTAANSNSSYSTAKYRTCDLPAPTVSISANSSGKAKLTWKAVTGAVQYKVYCSTDNTNWTLIKTVTGTSLTHASATLGTTYYYRVMAIASNTSANSAYSSVKSFTSKLATPSVSISANSSGKAKLTWNKVTDAVQYKVYCSTDNTNWTLLKTVTGTSLTHTSATLGTTYYYKVKAVASNSSNDSAYSSVKSFTAKLVAPTVTLTTSSTGKTKLTWNKVTDAVQYKVYCSTDKSNWTLIKTVTGTSLTHASASKGTTYYYRVMAVASNSSANSPYSTIVSRTSR